MNMDLSENTAKRLYELRTKSGYTMEKLAEMVGVSKGTISKWENGSIKNMRRDKVLILAKIFNVSPTYILGYNEHSRELDQADRINRFSSLYSQLQESEKVVVDKLLESLVQNK